MPRPIPWRRPDHTSPLIWLVAIVCAILAVASIVSGVVIFAIYMIYQPKVPYIHITAARLNRLDYDQSGLLGVEIAVTVAAENDNAKADASFSDARFALEFHGVEVAELRAGAVNVPKNSSYPLDYVVKSAAIPLDAAAMEEMDSGLKSDRVSFGFRGQTRTRWRIGIFISVRFLLHISCQLQFQPSDGSSVGGIGCSSKSH
ncbi:hypothetical protein KSP39_PZI022548 [Platanthera zijinensis]|uniref:Late embryogenesis abundant protein LEA-2 subgroup domain-containing protein n=1 Tax=Platanthera zijinensis TaxID=2320716 RepID=A0AAP0AUB9_9ASPA